MTEVLLHVSCLTPLPAWEGDVFQPHVGWLDSSVVMNTDHINDELQMYSARYLREPASIHGLGILRPMRRAALFEHRIWRYIMGMDDRDCFNPALLHLVPLTIRPKRRLMIAYSDVHSVKLSIYVTPLAVRTQAIVALDMKAIERIREIGNAPCLVDKHPHGTLLDTVKHFHKQALLGLLAEPVRKNLSALPQPSYVAVGLADPTLAVEPLTQLFEDQEFITERVKPVLLKHDRSTSWKLIDQRSSIALIDPALIRSDRAKYYWVRHQSCHFNNWTDLLFIYESIYQSFKQLERWIALHPKKPVNAITVARLKSAFLAYEDLKTRAVWSRVIESLDGSHDGAEFMAHMYAELKILPIVVSLPERLTYLTRNLRKRQNQEAKFGLYTPPYILTDIEDTRKKIAEIEAELARRQIARPPEPQGSGAGSPAGVGVRAPG
jgi:hypothetical protein